MRAQLGEVVPESSFSCERELILGLIDDSRGDPQAAPCGTRPRRNCSGPSDPRVDAWVASLRGRGGRRARRRFKLTGARSAKRKRDSPPRRSSFGRAAGGSPGADARGPDSWQQSEILGEAGPLGRGRRQLQPGDGQGLGGAEARYRLRAPCCEQAARRIAPSALTLERLAAKNAASANPGPSGTGRRRGRQGRRRRGNRRHRGRGNRQREGSAAGATKNKNKFWRKLASETLADEKAKNGAKEGMKQ